MTKIVRRKGFSGLIDTSALRLSLQIGGVYAIVADMK